MDTGPDNHPDPDSCYRALLARDARFDGVFFTGVTTTGIYCRPVCAVRAPRRSSCVFFGSAAAAEAAGFRPCLRCRPEMAPYALQQNLAFAVWQRIAAGALNEGGDEESGGPLERLAAEVGLSSRQVRRVLLRHFGVTPVELAQTQRLLFAKKLLSETALAMPDVAFAAGFRSVRRFNALFASRYRMAPGALRRAGGEGVAPGALTIRLAYRPPYAWEQMMRYLAGRAIPGVEAVVQEAGALQYLRSVRLQGVAGWLRASHLPQRGQIVLQAASQLAPLLMPLAARVRSQFDLDANPAAVEAHLGGDSLLAPIIAQAPGLRVPGAFDTFELAVRAVLGQQISVAGATTLAGRLALRFGQPADTPAPQLGLYFPTPAELAGVPVEAIAALGLPGARARTLLQLARFAADGGLAFMPGVTLEDAVSRLKTVPGIGEWTAQYIALRGLRFPDAFPAGDLGLQKAASGVAGGRLDEAGLRARAAGWAPWRGYAALLLWQALHSSATEGKEAK